MTPEKRVENEIKAWVWNEGGWVVKLHAGMEQGRDTLDLLGGLYQRPFLVEVKKVGGIPSLAQLILVERALSQGYVSGIVDSLESFKRLFKKEV